MDGPHSISPQDLYGPIGTASSPVVLDVRRDAAFNADKPMLVSAEKVCKRVLCRH
jgi:hypothetical protein